MGRMGAVRVAASVALISLLLGGCARRYPPTHAAGVLSAAGISSSSPGALFLRSKPLVLLAESFDRLDLTRWREVEVKGRTEYASVTLDGSMRLRAHSHEGSSILLLPFRFNPETYEWLSWRWRVDQFVEGEQLERKDGSDASARVYVYFNTVGLPWQKRNIDYVWSSRLPVGTIMDSAFSKSSKIIVVESGQEAKGKWRVVIRNIERDYEQCFPGEDVPDVISIGLMTDTDNTRSEALTYFDDLMVSRQKPDPSFTVAP